MRWASARRAGNRVVMLDEGRVVEAAPPEQFFAAPTEERTNQFLAKLLH